MWPPALEIKRFSVVFCVLVSVQQRDATICILAISLDRCFPLQHQFLHVYPPFHMLIYWFLVFLDVGVFYLF